LGAHELRHRRLAPRGLAGVQQRRAVVGELPRCRGLRSHLREVRLNELEFGDRFPELLALLPVRAGELDAALRRADAARADADTTLCERLERGGVSLAQRSEEVLRGDLAILADELGDVRAAEAHRRLEPADRE